MIPMGFDPVPTQADKIPAPGSSFHGIKKLLKNVVPLVPILSPSQPGHPSVHELIPLLLGLRCVEKLFKDKMPLRKIRIIS